MKPITLRIRGLNSFLEEQVIDFRKLTSRGIFGIFGATGSGKTSILDGITLSLYGEISRNTKDFINTNSESAYVSFEFEMSGKETKRYRVEREFRRNKSGGVTTKYAKMITWDQGDMVILEERPVKVNDQCEAVIGLTKEDFTRTVVLPQGKFSEFLKLKNKDRGEMLERIFNLQQYGDELTSKLGAHGKKVRLKETALSGQLKAYEEVNAHIVEQHETLLVEQNRTYEEAIEMMAFLQKSFSETEAVWHLQKDLETAKELYREKLEMSHSFAELRETLEKAEAAQNLWSSVIQWEKFKENLRALTLDEAAKKNEKDGASHTYETALQAYAFSQKQRGYQLPEMEAAAHRLAEALEKSQKLERQQEKIEGYENEKNDWANQSQVAETHLAAKINRLAILDKRLTDEVNTAEQLRTPNELKVAITDLNHRQENLMADESQYNSILTKIEVSKKSIIAAIEEKSHLEQNRNEAQGLYDEGTRQIQLLEEKMTGAPEKLLKLNEVRQDVQNKWKQWEEAQKNTENLEDHLEKGAFMLQQDQKALVELMAHKKQIEEALETLKSLEYAIALRKQLLPGKACPVCGSVDHPLTESDFEWTAADQKQTENLAQVTFGIEDLQKKITIALTQHQEWRLQLEQWQNAKQGLGTDFLSVSVAQAEADYNTLNDEWQKNQAELKQQQHMALQQGTILNQWEKNLASLESRILVEQTQLKTLEAEAADLGERLQNLRSLLLMDQAKHGVMDIPSAYLHLRQNEDTLEKVELSIKEIRDEGRVLGQEIESDKFRQQEILNRLIALESTLKVEKDTYQKEMGRLTENFGPVDRLAVTLERQLEAIESIKNAYESSKLNHDQAAVALKKAEEAHLLVQNALKIQSEQYDEADRTLQQLLRESRFSSAEEVKANMLTAENRLEIKSRLDSYHEEVQRLQGGIQQLVEKLSGRVVEPGVYEELTLKKEAQGLKVQALSEERTALKTKLDQLKRQYETLQSLLEDKAKLDLEIAYITDLEKLFQGKRFVGYIAIHQLIYISGKASEQLMEISQGNYGLEIDEEGNFMIRDYKNGGVSRDPASLSGGETFMVSLALALSLSAQIQLKGTAPLEFFFLDEGFGTLDEDTLDVVMTALERLHHEQLSIGLISHVDTIKARVPIQLLVSAAKSGVSGSRVTIEYS